MHSYRAVAGPRQQAGRKTLAANGPLRSLLPAGAAPGNRAATRAIPGRGEVPVLLGGDDSVPVPLLAAFVGDLP
jgi:arginase family enzyme